jgi:uncharacterized membrane protein
MRIVEATTEIDAPAEDVFALVADLDRLPEWQTDIVAVRAGSPEPRVGATAEVTRAVMGRHVTAPLRVTAWEPPRRMAISSEVQGVRAEGHLEVEPIGPSRSRLGFRLEIHASGLKRVAEPLIASAASEEAQASLERLKHLLERRPAAAQGDNATARQRTARRRASGPQP